MSNQELIVGGIYQHYKGEYYKVLEIADHHEGNTDKRIVIYQACHHNGLFRSIRSGERIIYQPFYRLESEWFQPVQPPQKLNFVPRFVLAYHPDQR